MCVCGSNDLCVPKLHSTHISTSSIKFYVTRIAFVDSFVFECVCLFFFIYSALCNIHLILSGSGSRQRFMSPGILPFHPLTIFSFGSGQCARSKCRLSILFFISFSVGCPVKTYKFHSSINSQFYMTGHTHNSFTNKSLLLCLFKIKTIG